MKRTHNLPLFSSGVQKWNSNKTGQDYATLHRLPARLRETKSSYTHNIKFGTQNDFFSLFFFAHRSISFLCKQFAILVILHNKSSSNSNEAEKYIISHLVFFRVCHMSTNARTEEIKKNSLIPPKVHCTTRDNVNIYQHQQYNIVYLVRSFNARALSLFVLS